MPISNLSPGLVTLVGAGPGDPELLTLKAVKAIQAATVLLVDDLVNDEVLLHANPHARIVHVGKRGGCASTPQSFIEKLMISEAQRGEQVVRLKGGDPFIFGRGGEEIEMLMEHKIPFQVVPGITAANGVSCYAGIPLTHRDYAQSCTFVTGHMKDERLTLEWDSLAKPNQTIVIYMGLLALSQICEQLIKHGASKGLPIAVVEQGTTSGQKVVSGSLSDITQKVDKKKLQSPSLIIIGDVVRLRKKLNWFS